MPDDLLGSLISKKYRLIEVLGKGAMGIVYRAVQLDAQGAEVREVALKMIRRELLDDSSPKPARRFVTEVHATARLKSPNVVTVYDFGQSEDGALYYVMELVDGPTLRGILDREGPLPVERVLIVGAQICEALHAAHTQGKPIVHRDLKPANVFIDRWPEGVWARVCDFGIAKILGEDSSGVTRTGVSPGTPRYMAPEQWRGEGVDPRTDLYALGAILFELLTGHAPFGGDANSLLYQHQHRPPPSLPASVPAPLQSLVERLLAKNPADRPSSAAQVRREIEAIAAHVSRNTADPTAATGSGAGSKLLPLPSVPRVGRSRRLVIGGSAAVAVMVVAGGLATLFPKPLARLWTRFDANHSVEKAEEQAEPIRPKKVAEGIAVLVFRNERRNDKENDWISTALQTAFSTELGKVNQLKILSQDSFEMGAPAANPIAMLKQIGASKFISGSFAIHAGSIRVDARMVDVATGVQEHARSVQGRFEDFFDLQKRLALAMLEELSVEVSDKERSSIAARNPSKNPAAALDAYKLLLQGEGLDEPAAAPSGPAAKPEMPKPDEPKRNPAVSMWWLEGLGPSRAWGVDEQLAAVEAVSVDGRTKRAILEALEEYRRALESADLNAITDIRGELSERQRAGLQLYFQNAANLRVDFESIDIEPGDGERFAVSYLRRDSFTDRRTDENVTLEIRIETAAFRVGPHWHLTNDRQK